MVYKVYKVYIGVWVHPARGEEACTQRRQVRRI